MKFDTIPNILTVFCQNNPRINTHNVSTNFRTGGCHPLLKIDGWISTRANRSNGGPAVMSPESCVCMGAFFVCRITYYRI